MNNQLEAMKQTVKKVNIRDSGLMYIFKGVILSWPNLETPVPHPEYPNGEPQYSFQVILTSDQALDFANTIKQNIIDKQLPMPEPFNFHTLKVKTLDNEKLAAEPRLYQQFSRNFYSKFTIILGVIDKENGILLNVEPAKIKQEFYAGCVCDVQVLVRLRHDDNAVGAQYSIFPKQILKIEDGEPFGSSTMSLGQGMDLSRYGVTEVRTGNSNPQHVGEMATKHPINNEAFDSEQGMTPPDYKVSEEELKGAMEGLLDE